MAAPYNVVAQLPQHIVDTYPQFAEFLTQYYAFLNEDGEAENILSNILTYGDIDTTIASFKEHILDELMADIPNNILADRVLLAKHIKELYNKSGTEDSYRLLFRILFNKEIDVYYPGEQVIKTSNDVWKQDISFACQVPTSVTANTVKLAINNKILVTIGAKVLPVYVYDVVQLATANPGYNAYEFFIKKDFTDNFNNATTFTINQLSSITIVSGGSRYKDYDTVEINSTDGGDAQASFTTTKGSITAINLFSNGAGFITTPIITINSENGIGAYLSGTITTLYTGTILTSPAKLKVIRTALDYPLGGTYDIPYLTGIDLVAQVNELNPNTSVKNFTITRFGQYYPSKFYKVINRNPKVAEIKCGVSNFPAHNKKLINGAITFGGLGYTVAPTVTVIGDGFGAQVTVGVSGGSVTSITIVNAGYGYTVPPALVLSDSSIVIEGGNNKLRTYQGTYENTTGTLSSDMAIYDGEYYQTFSYELIVSELFDDYKSVLKKLVHPISYAVWAQYELQTISQIQISTYKLSVEGITLFRDTVAMGNSAPIFDVSKQLEDAPQIGEGLSVFFTMAPIEEPPTIINDAQFSIAFSPADVPETVIGTLSIPVFDVGKALQDTPVTDDTNISIDFVYNNITPETVINTDSVPVVDFVKAYIPETVTNTDGLPEVDFVKASIPETVTNTDSVPEVDFVKDDFTETVNTTTGETVTPVLTTYTTDQLQRGYWAGGTDGSTIHTQIDGIIFSSEAATNPAAALISGRHLVDAVHSTSHGYFCGGYTSTLLSVEIDGIRFGSETALNPSASLAQTRQQAGSVSSSTKGYIGGGMDDASSAVYADIYTFTFNTETSADIAANLATARYSPSGIQSSTEGYWCGGYSLITTPQTQIDSVVFSTDTATNPSGNLSPARAEAASMQSSTKGYICSGFDDSAGDYSQSVDTYVFSTETHASLGVGLSAPMYERAGNHSSTKGYIGGGYDMYFFTASTRIESIVFSTDTISVIGANLATARYGSAAVNP